MRIQELLEAETAGATGTSSIASLGGSPHRVAGTPAVLKRWSGSPGKTGKSIKPPVPKTQTPKDNALDKKSGSIIA